MPRERVMLIALVALSLVGLAFAPDSDARLSQVVSRALAEPSEDANEPAVGKSLPTTSQAARMIVDGAEIDEAGPAAPVVVEGAEDRSVLAKVEPKSGLIDKPALEPAGKSEATLTYELQATTVAPGISGDQGAAEPEPVAAPVTTAKPTTTTAKPTTTTAAPAASPGRVLLNAPIAGLPTLGYGSSESAVRSNLGQQFGSVLYGGSQNNWDDFAVVSNSGDTYLRTRSNVGNDSHKQFVSRFDQVQEAYLVYSFYLEPGFDAGDGKGSAVVHSTGIKMPGLILGHPAQNTGGKHTEGGFTGRLMIRGTRKSDGVNTSTREGLSLAAYIYGQEIAGQDIASGYGEDYLFLNGFNTTAFEGLQGGKHEGIGDPRIWDLQVGTWVTVVLGYRVDGDNGWFKAWTSSGGGSLQPRLHVPNVNWTGDGATQGIDRLLFQQFWGGNGSEWYPDTESYMRFKDFGVYTSESAALAAAR